MNFKIEINMDNAAFDDTNAAYQLETILNRIVKDISALYELTTVLGGVCKDSNGNTVGKWSIY